MESPLPQLEAGCQEQGLQFPVVSCTPFFSLPTNPRVMEDAFSRLEGLGRGPILPHVLLGVHV